MRTGKENILLEQLAIIKDELTQLHNALSATSIIEKWHCDKIQTLCLTIEDLLNPQPSTEVKHLIPAQLEQELDKEIVLIVEDDESILQLLEHHFIAENKFVILANNAEDALKIAETNVPDLIISDVVMGGMDGYNLCKIFKSRVATSHIPIVLLTAKSDFENKLTGLEAGADDYIYKPFSIKELGIRVRNLLLQRKTLRDSITRQLLQTQSTSHEHSSLSKEKEFIAKVRTFVEKNLSDENYTVDRLAYETCLSRVQLFRKLKSLAGISPLDFIISIRLRKAAQLLKEGNMNIAEICFLVGFGMNQSNFTRRFKDHYGVLPSDFSEKNRKM